jgi:hypothetical protein
MQTRGKEEMGSGYQKNKTTASLSGRFVKTK